MEQKCIAQCSGGEMSAKRLAVLVVPVLVLVSSALAQVNEVSITAGRTFVSTQTVPTTGLPVHFGNEESVEFNYGRFLRSFKVFGLYAELPVAIYPRMDVNYHLGTTPKASERCFPPWVSVGGGYGRFREAPVTLYENPNPGPTGTNTGVVQFGAGLDVWVWHTWGGRFEARDFYSGNPALNVDTGRSRQHNYYVGVGVIHRF
jgi:hypothetical protein